MQTLLFDCTFVLYCFAKLIYVFVCTAIALYVVQMLETYSCLLLCNVFTLKKKSFLGIQQKYIIVTCNYVARELGVNKLMSVTDAVEKCPQLVLVKGEDLTHYREMSYKVTGEKIIHFMSIAYVSVKCMLIKGKNGFTNHQNQCNNTSFIFK